MGRSDPFLQEFYNERISLKGDTALLGFIQQGKFGLNGDLYDYQLNNWEINTDWKLDKKYDTIISLRCPYFAKDPKKFIEKCFDNLKEGGTVYLDWGYGHHWTGDGFKFKVGWKKDDEQEYAYFDQNFLQSGIWYDEFLDHSEFIKFTKAISKYGYDGDNIKNIIYDETPYILNLEEIGEKYDIDYDILTLWQDAPGPKQKEELMSRILYGPVRVMGPEEANKTRSDGGPLGVRCTRDSAGRDWNMHFTDNGTLVLESSVKLDNFEPDLIKEQISAARKVFLTELDKDVAQMVQCYILLIMREI